MKVVVDAAPIIFLAKIAKLSVIQKVVAPEVHVPSAVRDEIMTPPMASDEERRIRRFLESCRMAHVEPAERYARGLSFADNCVLTVAVRIKAKCVLADDKLLRKAARFEGITTVGTLGVLLRCVGDSIISRADARQLIKELIHIHHFRVSIEVYDEVMSVLDRGR